MVLILILCLFFLFFGCADTERDSPNDPGSPNYIAEVNPSSSSSSFDALVWCHSGSFCLNVSNDMCSALDGAVVSICPAGSSSSLSASSGSSSSGAFVSSSSQLDYDVFCKIGETCGSIPVSVCVAYGGTPVESCAFSSSSEFQSSSSEPPSSSSGIEQSSSSSVEPPPVSSSSEPPSSSSVEPSSSGCSIEGGTVKIGEQTWMAKNLNCDVSGSVCYDNDPENCDTYGRLYDWATAKTVCPSGWYLPSDAEWYDLMESVGGTSAAGTKLKKTSGWYDEDEYYIPGTDYYDFSALPGGNGYSDGSFSSAGNFGYWWSSSEDEDDSDYAYYWGMFYNDEYAYRIYGNKAYLFSVRCVQD